MDANKIEPSIYRYVLTHTKKDQLLILLMVLLSMPFVYVSLEIPKIIINSALSGIDIPEQILGVSINQIEYLLVLCGTFLLLILINGGLKYLINVYRGILGERMLRRFRFDLFARLMRFPVARFKHLSQAEIIPMVTAETEPLGGFIGDAFALPAFQGGLLITYLFFIFNQDLWLGLMAVALYPPQLYVIPKLQRRVNQLAKQRVQAVRKFADKVGESVSGIADIHVNDTSRYEKAHVSHRLATIYNLRFDIYRRKFFIKFLNNFLAQITPLSFYAVGGYFVITGKLTLGALVVVLAAYKDLSSPWRELLKYYQITEDVRVKYQQIIDQFQPDNMLHPGLQQEQDATAVDMSAASVQVSAISYGEDDFVKSLDGVSFEVDAGHKIGVLGLAGSGRGVLSQLIVRLLQPGYGKIRISACDIAELSESILGRNMAYVDQNSYIFTGTVKQNLLYGLKSRPLATATSVVLQAEQKYIKEAEAAANSSDDIDADWINIATAGFTDQDSFDHHTQRILQTAGLEDDVYQFGLYSTINDSLYPELTAGILKARQRLRQALQQDEYKKLVEGLNSQQYNTHLSVAENLLFGMPAQPGVEVGALLANAEVAAVIEVAELKEPLFRVGLQTTRIMVEMFSGVPEASPLFERFSFIETEDLPDLGRLAKLPDDVDIKSLADSDLDKIMQLPYKLIVARHRLGMITPEIQQKIVNAHAMLKTKLGDSNDLIEFYSADKVARHLTIQDNILFGRIAYGQAKAKQKVGKLIHAVISELGLVEQIIKVGLDYTVGVAGARLTSSQRQKLTIARALMKRPKVLVLNEATTVLDDQIEKVLVKRILQAMQGGTVIWVLSNRDYIDRFDRLLLLDKGKLVADGPPQQFK